MVNEQPETPRRTISPTTLNGTASTPKPVRYWPDSVRRGEWSEVPQDVRDEYRVCCDEQRWPFVLCGDWGVGKSVFAALAYREWPIGAAYFLPAATAASTLKTAEIHGVTIPNALDPLNDGQLLRKWCQRAGLLVLDDLTNGLTFANAVKSLWRIINERAGRPAIYTANGSPDEIAAELGGSLSDRLFQGTCVLWPGESRRRQQGRFVVAKTPQ